MTILSSDLKLRASVVMADVPEGGGGPGAGVINWGDSNTIFEDVDSVSRTLGNVSIRQLHAHVDTGNTDKLLGSYAIVAKGPEDAKVSVTLATCAPFDRRTQIQTAIANYLIRGTQWGGYLLEDHVQGQLNIQIFQRPGARKPTIGRTLVLVVDEGKGSERLQYVRVIKVDAETRTFTEIVGGTAVDFQADVVKCDLQSPLGAAFPGTGPSRTFATGSGKTVIRDTSEADAANYYGMATLSAAAHIGALQLKVGSVYSQLVPNSQTSVPALDQRPAARRTLQLAAAPRAVEVAITPHTYRTKIGQENRGLSYIAQCTPPPEPGTLVLTWVGLGNRYSIADDGAGALAGDGAGTVNYATGSVAISLPSLPDVGSALVYNWGTRIAYTNRAGQGVHIRAPEYAWVLAGDTDDSVRPGTLAGSYTSGGIVRNIGDDGAGGLTGDATGRVDYVTRTVVMRPTYMPDPAAAFAFDYETEVRVTDVILEYTGPSAEGFVSFALSQQPAAGTVSLQWLTRRKTYTQSGGMLQTRTPPTALPDAAPENHVAAVPSDYSPVAHPLPSYPPLRFMASTV